VIPYALGKESAASALFSISSWEYTKMGVPNFVAKVRTCSGVKKRRVSISIEIGK
jgi:hypothetical protein